ncbi:uncharacterized protein LOC122128588 [Clupea harengus]|uniref:Uncharacterized protein LOC122128588 n=1 Tax=Clupea harengus TaxID=7950 RepID=A0A8M1K8G7_CLUHA|nr:uncharacterized protein LOC122128588 [Clupea harengus]
MGLGQPSYNVKKTVGLSVEESGHSAVTSFGSEPAGNSNTNPPPEDASPLDFKEQLKSQPMRPAADAAAPEIHTTESSPTPVHRKQAKVEFPEVENLLVEWGLLPPVVTCEKCSVEQRFMCSVRVQLDGYTFQSPGSFRSKKEATRKAFHSFALAAEICQPGADEIGSTQAVKQYFAQRSQPCPKEKCGKEGKENAFSCSLTDVTCSLDYKGQGSSEGEARQAAFLNAFTKLSRLFSASGTPGALGVGDDQLTTLLKLTGQAEPVYSLKAQQYKASIQLKFSGYTLENKSTTNKKLARNYLSARILKMLGVDTDASTSGSPRNSLDEWFKGQKLPGPDFEELKEPLGVQVTFSAPFSCSSPDWKDTWAHAERSLVQELSARFTWNKEEGTAGSGSSSL